MSIVYIASICNRDTEGHRFILGVFSSRERLDAFIANYGLRESYEVDIERWELDIEAGNLSPGYR